MSQEINNRIEGSVSNITIIIEGQGVGTTSYTMKEYWPETKAEPKAEPKAVCNHEYIIALWFLLAMFALMFVVGFISGKLSK
jgi:hypothetical protein